MRRYICVPKDQAALEALDYDQATPDQLLELVLTEEEFNALWHGQIFEAINQIANTLIDAYEDEQITDKAQLIAVLESGLLNPALREARISHLIEKLRELFLKAIEYSTGVFFYL